VWVRDRAMGIRDRSILACSLGRMDMRKANRLNPTRVASTMSLSLANGIGAICCIRTRNITMSIEPTCPWTRMRHFRAQ
jgi:hypothetical protein